jgi:lysophospholipase II
VEYLGVTKTKFILPTAPQRAISLNRGMAMPGWSDIFGLHADDPEDAIGFAESVNRINLLVEREIVEHQIPPSRIIIGGFSQGGALALHYSLRHPSHSFGGCVAFSSWVPFHKDYPTALSSHAASLPILQAHGTADAVVGYEWGQKSHLLLKSLITNPEPILLSIPVSFHPPPFLTSLPPTPFFPSLISIPTAHGS